jgi:hypothetical protein
VLGYGLKYGVGSWEGVVGGGVLVGA